MTLAEFNQLPEAEAFKQLYGCCHCQSWAQTLAEARPFMSRNGLFAAAELLWRQADEKQILEAFSGHARIGDIELLRSRYAGRATAEQGQVMQASDEVLRELQQLNIDYETRHGFIFIVCASGKSAEEMLALLKARIDNDRAIELMNGAAAQGAITKLRLLALIDA